MRGYPKFLNSKADYEYVRQHFSKDEWEKDWRNLLDTAYDWFNEGELAEGDAGIEDETHKVVLMDEEGTKSQFVYKLNPYAKIFRLGFTEAEVRRALA